MLIAIMISIVVGVSLIPTLTGLKQDEGSPVPSVLLDILVYVFVVVIMMGAVAWIGWGSDSSKSYEYSGRVLAWINPYVKRHGKLVKGILIFGIVALALQLLTYIGSSVPTYR